MTRYLVLGATLAGWVAAVSSSKAQEPLAEALRKRAPAIVKRFAKEGYENVGVLKFLARHEHEKKLHHNVGALNQNLARHLEMVLAMSIDAQKPVWIIKNASATANRTPGANQLTAVGRQALLNASYPMVWISKTVKADAFLTGNAVISKDLRSLSIDLEVFDKNGQKYRPVGSFQAAIEPYMLTGVARDYLYRDPDLDDDEKPKEEKEKEQKVKERIFKNAVGDRQAGLSLAQLNAAPVQLEVYYNDMLIPLGVEKQQGESRFVVPEPKSGADVRLLLKRDGSAARYAIVLKVNGENTLEKQTQEDLFCHAWVLEPSQRKGLVAGYQVGNKSEAFQVLSEAESRLREVNYGAKTGTITMTVFRESKSRARKPDLDESPEKTTERLVAELPDLAKDAPPADTPQELLFTLLQKATGRSLPRGLIVPGTIQDNPVETVPFQRDPHPILAITIFYRPR